MSDSKLGAQARGQRNLVPEVLDKAPAGTELGWVVWVANPSSGGGTVNQGKKGSSGESWYVQDGSGLLATAAKQDAGNASLAAIDSKLGSPLAVTGPLTNTELRASAVPISATTLPLPTGAATELTVTSILAQLDSKTSTLATQVTAAATLAQLDAKTSTLATASAQATGNASLSTIATQQTDGTQKTQVTSSALPTGAATAAKQPALGTAGTPSADVLSVQGVVGGTPQPISASSLPLPTGAATSALQGGGLPAALVGGRLDSNVGAWLGSTAPSVGQKTAANSLPVVLASDTGTLTVATNVTAGSTVGETFANCSTAQILLAATAAPKVRKIYNRAGNGRLFIRYGSAPTAEADCSFAVEPGSSWEMPVLAPGVLEYAGNVYGIIPSGASTAHGLQVT